MNRQLERPAILEQFFNLLAHNIYYNKYLLSLALVVKFISINGDQTMKRTSPTLVKALREISTSHKCSVDVITPWL